MNCIYLKQKLNRKLECKKNKNKIIPKDCTNCILKTYKCTNNHQIKNKSNKLAKLERNRFSLFTDDLEHCIICGKSPVNKHEIFGGRNRLNSIKYGLVIPLCTCEHHDQINCKGIHFDKKLQDEWHIKGETKFNEVYPDLIFKDIFKKNKKKK